jgi:hypothetical protein
VPQSLSQQHHRQHHQQPRKLADFEWDIVRKAGYPIFSFTNSTQSEVMFKYSVSELRPVRLELSNISGERLWRIVTRRPIFQPFCYRRTSRKTNLRSSWTYCRSSSRILIIITNRSNVRPLIFAFVDYVYDPADGSDESVINFQTNVTLAVDLTAGFVSLGLRWSRCCGARCCDFSSISRSGLLLRRGLEIPPPVFSQGSVLQFCVEMNENVTTTGVYVMTF